MREGAEKFPFWLSIAYLFQNRMVMTPNLWPRIPV